MDDHTAERIVDHYNNPAEMRAEALKERTAKTLGSMKVRRLSGFLDTPPVVSVWAVREGGEDDPDAELVVYIERSDGEPEELIRERLDSNFSTSVKV